MFSMRASTSQPAGSALRRSALASATIFAALVFEPAAAIACWQQAGERYGLSPALLYAIAKVESNLQPQALNLTHRARTGTYDIGLMQINSSHLRALARFGIGEQELQDPCTNIHVGAWLLADSLRRHGFNWNAVGAYNAACSELKGSRCEAARSRYAWQVYRGLPAMPTTGAAEAPASRSLDLRSAPQ